jgi:hypothetical protein
MPSSHVICFIVEKMMPPPTSRDLDPMAAVVVIAVVAVVSLSEVESWSRKT